MTASSAPPPAASALHWPPLADDPLRGLAGVHLYSAGLDVPDERVIQLRATLSREELNRAGRFHFATDHRRFVTGRGVLREILGHHLSVPPARVEFSYGPHGKPELGGSLAGRLFFNVAHSQAVAVFAVTRQGEIGVDVEFKRPIPQLPQLAAIVFSPEEAREWRALPPAERPRAFFDGWTRKEAFLKGRGEGLGTPPGACHVSLRRPRPDELWEVLDEGRAATGWLLASISDAHYAIAVAFSSPPTQVSQREWRGPAGDRAAD